MVTFNDPTDGARTASGIPVSNRGMTGPEESRVSAPSPLTVSPVPEMGIGRVSWRAVGGGALLSVSLLILSTALARACGVPAFTGGEYGLGAALWTIVSAGAACFAGAYMAVCLRGNRESFVGFLHGICVWSLAVPVSYVIFSGTIIGLTTQLGFIGRANSNDVIGAMNGLMGGSPAAAAPVVHNPYIGPGWGLLIALLVGLAGAALGGLIPSGANLRTMGRDLARQARPM